MTVQNNASLLQQVIKKLNFDPDQLAFRFLEENLISKSTQEDVKSRTSVAEKVETLSDAVTKLGITAYENCCALIRNIEVEVSQATDTGHPDDRAASSTVDIGPSFEQLCGDTSFNLVHVAEQNPNYYCPVMKEILFDPYQTTCCGNLISKRAFLKLSKSTSACPVCRSSEFSAFQDTPFQTKIRKLKVRCRYGDHGCRWEGCLDDLLKHYEELKDYHDTMKKITSIVPQEFILSGFEEFRKSWKMWFSPSFYTHPNGYRMCLRVDVEDNGHLSVYAYLMKGAYDDSLKFPFSSKVTVQLIKNQDKPHQCDIVFDESTDPKHTTRVVEGERQVIGFGNSKFIPIHKLQNYLEHDSLKFNVTTSIKVPSAPVAIEACNITATSMTISWQPPQNANGIIKCYQVSYTPHGESERIHDVDSDITSTELTSLVPCTEYTIRVRAKTVEFGDSSNPITATTSVDEILEKKMAHILDHYKDVSFHGLTVGKLIFYGIPRSGKTTLRKQIVRSIENRIEDGGKPEPSTNIGEICDPIMIERVLAKSEEGNEWKWTVQGLDDLAKTLLQSIDIELSRTESSQQEKGEAPKLQLPSEPSAPKAMYTYEARSITVAMKSVSSEPSTQKGAISQMISLTDAQKSVIAENQDEAFDQEVDLKELILDAIKTGKWEEVVKALHLLDNAMLLQIIDCGGQPTFQEIHPLLISGPSVTLLMFNLKESLTQPQKVRYLRKHPNQHEEEQTWQDETYVPKDFILQAISSQVKLDSKLLLIGTHKDALGDSEEQRLDGCKRIAAQLHELLLKSNHLKLMKDSKQFHDFCIGIDNFQPKDILQVKNKIENLIPLIQPTDEKGTPAQWLVFDFILHKYAKSKKLGKIEIAMCHRIAKKCGIKDDNEEIDLVLFFLHRKAGTLLYYPHIPELKNFVFTDFQPIIDSISSIIIDYFNHHDESKNGFLKTSNVRKIDGYLDADELISLMRHRHIISHVNTETLFMPSLLPKAEPFHNALNNLCSFLVVVNSEYCSIGVFSAVSTRLASTKNWKINESVPQFRNRMYFIYVLAEVTYEIIFTSLNDCCDINEKHVPRKVRLDVCKDIREAFKDICEDLKLAIPSYDLFTTLEDDSSQNYIEMQSKITEEQKSWSHQTSSEEQRSDKCRCFTLINGKAGVIDMEDYGLTISYKSDCLPPSIKECKLLISADMTTDIPLPSGSLLVSGVYHINTMPSIDQLNQPVEISMEHCAKDFNNLSFVVAKECHEQEFKYMEGGQFEIDGKTGRSVGKIFVTSFSIWAVVEHTWRWLTGQGNAQDVQESKSSISYCGRKYYDDTSLHRNIHFVITKNLSVAKDILAKEFPFKDSGDMKIEFSASQNNDQHVHLDLPEGIIGNGWKLVPDVEPTEITQVEVDEFGIGKRLPQCKFSAQWTRNDSNPTVHYERISLVGTKQTSFSVECAPASSPQTEVRDQVKKLEGGSDSRGRAEGGGGASGGGEEGEVSSGEGEGRGEQKREIKFTHVSQLKLDEDDLVDVLEAVIDMKAKWKSLGLVLRLKVAELDTISSKNHIDPTQNLTDMLRAWLQQCYDTTKFGLPSWRMLCEAISKPAGGDNPALARKIADLHSKKCYKEN